MVVGGGLAGITAAVELADAGRSVTLLESRPRLGGATYSFARGDLTVDTGQHVFLRCYTAYRALLRRLGTEELAPLQRRLDIPVLAEDRPGIARVRRDRLPAPLHLLRGVLGYRLLPWRSRLATGRAAAALRRLDLADSALDERTFGSWLTEQGVPVDARTGFFDLLTRAALNGTVDQVSLSLAAFVFRTALLEQADAADLGIALVPLQQLHGEAAGRLLSELGVQVRTHTRVRSVRVKPTGLQISTDTATLAAAGVVLAVPHPAAARLLADVQQVPTERWAGLGAVPIVNVHVHYDRQVTDLAFAAVADSEVQWFFDRTAAVGATGGQWLSLSVSAATDVVDTPTGRLRERVLAALARVLPATRTAAVLDVTVTRERAATFDQRPGTAALRPPARTAVPGLVLAGAWTATGWPDTMEGAVRSGSTAARQLLGAVRGPADASLPAAHRPPVNHPPPSGQLRTADQSRLDDLPQLDDLPRLDDSSRTEELPTPHQPPRTTGAAMTITTPTDLAVARELVTPTLRAAVDRLAPPMQRVAAYQLGWADAEGRPAEGGGGKALRPALALLCAEAAGGTIEAGLPAAAAVELVHNFSLLHDDIVDGDRERRHRPTAWTVFGQGDAMLAGNALLALASEVLLDDVSPTGLWAHRCLLAAVQRLIVGQHADLDFEQRSDVALAECLVMAGDKTAALLSCSCATGALLAGGDPAMVLGLTEFGEHLGLAFQLVDDLLGIWGSPEQTGKPVLSDLAAGKKSVPVVAAVGSGTAAGDELARRYPAAPGDDTGELRRCAELIERSGARDWVQHRAEEELRLAEQSIAGLPLPDTVQHRLVELAAYVTERDR